MDIFTDAIKYCLAHDGTDIHFGTDLPPAIRLEGKIGFLGQFPVITASQMEVMIHELLTPAQFEELRSGKEVDFAFSYQSQARFRVNVYKERRGLAMALRFIPDKIRTIEELGFPITLKHLLLKPHGFLLITGPTGSGKSTTVAAMVDAINQTSQSHIITIEDPIEYIHQNKKSLVKQREVGEGKDTRSFARALRAALREDPDVIIVGEMRDRETTSLAITAAETGHLVISTLHTNNAYQAIHRMVDIFPADQQQQIRLQLAQNLIGILAQRLLIKRGGGRVAALEIMMGTSAIRTQIRENKIQSIPNTIKTSRAEGMILLEDYILALAAKGIIDYEEGAMFLSDQSSSPG